jgi:hypothetical protein
MGETDLGMTWVGFQGAETAFDLQCPKNTNRVVLDPDHRLPRRYDLEAQPTD